MATTAGLSADPKEYRKRLAQQSDEQIDAWASELMRDVAIRRGVIRVIEDFRRTASWANLNSNGCSLLAVGRLRSSGATAKAT